MKEAQSRIIIAELHLDNAAVAICEAIKLKVGGAMTITIINIQEVGLQITRDEGFIWFFPAWLPKDFEIWEQKVYSRCTAQEIRKVS